MSKSEDKSKKKRKYYQGRFFPKNPKKYKGNVDNIVYRSGWELRAFKYFDENAFVIQWQSEELVIPYFDPTTGRHRRYFPDIVAIVKNEKGLLETLVIEIKPKKQTIEPEVKKRVTKRYIEEVTTWATNKSKWEAAIDFCESKGWKFHLMTEEHIFGY